MWLLYLHLGSLCTFALRISAYPYKKYGYNLFVTANHNNKIQQARFSVEQDAAFKFAYDKRMMVYFFDM